MLYITELTESRRGVVGYRLHVNGYKFDMSKEVYKQLPYCILPVRSEEMFVVDGKLVSDDEVRSNTFVEEVKTTKSVLEILGTSADESNEKRTAFQLLTNYFDSEAYNTSRDFIAMCGGNVIDIMNRLCNMEFPVQLYVRIVTKLLYGTSFKDAFSYAVMSTDMISFRVGKLDIKRRSMQYKVTLLDYNNEIISEKNIDSLDTIFVQDGRVYLRLYDSLNNEWLSVDLESGSDFIS